MYVDEGLVNADGHDIGFVGPVPLGDTGSLQGCVRLWMASAGVRTGAYENTSRGSGKVYRTSVYQWVVV